MSARTPTRKRGHANLGLATTSELIAELAARAEVSKAVGETWPDYRTVDEPPIAAICPGLVVARTPISGGLS